MATTLGSQRIEGDGAGRAATEFRVEPPRRRGRLPEVAVGAALMIGFALAAVLWHMSSTEKEPALALANPVERGDVIDGSDIRVVYVASDDGVALLGRDDAGALIGRVALADLPAGTLLTNGNVAPRAAVGPEEGVVGLALDPGQFPSATLLPGDLVNVIVGGDGTGAAATGPDGEGGQVVVLAAGAEVYAVEDLGTQGRKFVSLKLPEAEANRVAAAAQRGPVRLVLVGQ